MADYITCPFCGYRNINQYIVQLHIEERHTEDSPFTVQDGAYTRAGGSRPASSESGEASPPEDSWVRCTRPNCGEYVLLSQIDEHLDLHTAALLSEEESENPPPLPPRRRRSPTSPPQKPKADDLTATSLRRLEKQTSNQSETLRRANSTMTFFSSPSTSSRSTVRRMQGPRNAGRLGRRELGPHAYEKRMPDSVRQQLLDGARPSYIQRIGNDGRLVRQGYARNETVGLIRAISDLCARDEDNSASYLCHPNVRHIEKLRCDGNFCGYWSIQMVLTYVQHMNPRGPQEIPNVIQIQDLIEQAWERGICPYSKVETGGIRDTRKYIGTAEAVAFFTRIDVKVEALSIGGKGKNNRETVEELLDYVEAYFISGTDSAQTYGTSYVTQLSPIFFQRHGHSMVIVGLEREDNGSRNLLVFDSSFATPESMKRMLDGKRSNAHVDRLLKPYRRSKSSLRRFEEFELLMPQIAPPTAGYMQT